MVHPDCLTILSGRGRVKSFAARVLALAHSRARNASRRQYEGLQGSGTTACSRALW